MSQLQKASHEFIHRCKRGDAGKLHQTIIQLRLQKALLFFWFTNQIRIPINTLESLMIHTMGLIWAFLGLGQKKYANNKKAECSWMQENTRMSLVRRAFGRRP